MLGMGLKISTETLVSFGCGPSEVFDCCCGEFFEGHGPWEVREAIGPCDEFFGGQCCHGVGHFPFGTIVILRSPLPSHVSMILPPGGAILKLDAVTLPLVRAWISS